MKRIPCEKNCSNERFQMDWTVTQNPTCVKALYCKLNTDYTATPL